MLSKILIVDDQHSVREALYGLLTNQGYTLFFAENGAKALELANENTPDLMLLDVMMPEMDGFEVCQRIRAMEQLQDIPIILLTSLEDRESRLRGIQAGADDFITKPFEKNELRARIRTITRLNRYRRLMVQQERIAWIVENSEDGYVMINDDDEVLYANSKARLFLEQAEEGPIETPFLDIAKQWYLCNPPESWEIWPVPGSDSIDRYLVRPETMTSPALWLQVEVLKQSGKQHDEHLIRLRDVTQKIRANRTMWTFHQQISHKMRTPLTHLTSSLQYLHQSGETLPSQNRAELIEVAYYGSVRMQESIEDVLQYLDAALLDQPAIHFCLVEHILTIIDEIRADFGLDDVKTSYATTNNDDDYLGVVIPERAMRLILWELFQNAKKFHPYQKPQLEVQVKTTEAMLHLIVLDDGIHLSPEQLMNAWKPYYQGDKYFTGEVKGMGLGLAMISSIVWGVGGICKISNRIDKSGISVEIKLPLIE